MKDHISLLVKWHFRSHIQEKSRFNEGFFPKFVCERVEAFCSNSLGTQTFIMYLVVLEHFDHTHLVEYTKKAQTTAALHFHRIFIGATPFRGHHIQANARPMPGAKPGDLDLKKIEAYGEA